MASMTPPPHALGAGIAYALAAGLTWGLVFVAPVLLPDYPPAMLAFGRYLAFGLVTLPLALRDRAALARLSRADWREALALAAVGNVLYYLCLAASIQSAGVPLPTMIIGTLPVVIAVCANLSAREIAWRRLAPSLALVAAGVACVHVAELREPASGPGPHGLWTGIALATAALACWTWYPIRNARWLRRNPHVGPGSWASAQGLATLPLAVLGMAATLGWLALAQTASPGLPAGASTAASTAAGAAAGTAPFAWPLGPQPARYVGLMLAIGLLASWLGTLCWNRASQLLPTALAGQLIVFETLAALLYGFLHRGAWPDALTWTGVALLLAGVARGARGFQAGAPASG